LSTAGAPVRYKHDDEEAKIVAWEIHTDSFKTISDVGANFLFLVILIRTTDLPKFKVYLDGWKADDVIFEELSWYEKLRDKIFR